jgi:hypothetical protein
MASNVSSNVLSFPTYGKAITLDDQGTYYTLNTSTGAIHSIFRLEYDEDWYLYQLQNTSREDEICWRIMAEKTGYSLQSMTTEEIGYHFSKPEFAEPRGAWQVIRNSKFGFGKFTPLNGNEPIRHAIMVFEANEMLMPVLIHKAEEETMQMTEGEILNQVLAIAQPA